ncbi:Sec-independent protein translocase protein TatB [Pseudochrobactrum sp. HB0163]|uniref:Sec-independent protein translocase protein TatB n=1 Tax=Pseudochrobactrum sp. HB0163 TaxID=3450708 RepID=UPI003F6DAE12
MLDLGWSELLVIAVVMIVVVGPKDLPKMLRAFGRATAKLRATASEFRTHFDEALREAELDEVRKTIDDVKKYDPRKTVADIFEPVRSAGDDLRNSLNNATPKPDETPELAPAVPMDSPFDPAEMKDETAKAQKPAETAKTKPATEKTDAKKSAAAKKTAVKKTGSGSAVKAAATGKTAAKTTKKTGTDK